MSECRATTCAVHAGSEPALTADPHSYIFNGVTAQDIQNQCIAAYKFIVLKYEYLRNDIWLFGLSRGAYTVRYVGGLINNCGIVKPIRNEEGKVDDAKTQLLCEEVYRIYRSPYEINKPKSDDSIAFRARHSWPLIGDEPAGSITPYEAPVKFMGIFDTVGSLGLPNFTGGVGLDWPAFYDQNVSSVVERVYHAVGLHDRLYIFQPCLALRDMALEKNKNKPLNFGITQVWFPGVHYDLGRRGFKFFRDGAQGWLEPVLASSPFVSRVIEPNHVLADAVLKWMLQRIDEKDVDGLVIPKNDLAREIRQINARVSAPNPRQGDGDVYNKILEYAPFGMSLVNTIDATLGMNWRASQLYQVLFALRDRLIPDTAATVYPYKIRDPDFGNCSLRQIADIPDSEFTDADKSKRYPSSTYDSWILRTS